MDFVFAPDISRQIKKILTKVNLPWIVPERIVCFRSFGSSSKAQARIWSLPRIWQKALKVKSYYCIEVLSERFDRLEKEKQIKVLIHELLHIPKTFSGALLPHLARKRWGINAKKINELYKKYKNK